MNNIIIQLLDIADKADKNDDIDLAHKLDIYAKHLLQIKTAQYVGAQGYAIRNSRCWTNCYRTKRQASNISAHEAWSNCHKEYIESINKDGTAWDKYANANNTIKIASKTSNTLSYHIKFARSIKDNLANGSSLSYAIKNSLHNYESYLGKEIQIISKNLNKLAKQTNSNYSSDLYDAAESLQKEAQGFMANLVNQVKNVGQNVGQYAKNVGKNMPGLGRGILNVLKAPFTPNPQLISGYSGSLDCIKELSLYMPKIKNAADRNEKYINMKANIDKFVNTVLTNWQTLTQNLLEQPVPDTTKQPVPNVTAQQVPNVTAQQVPDKMNAIDVMKKYYQLKNLINPIATEVKSKIDAIESKLSDANALNDIFKSYCEFPNEVGKRMKDQNFIPDGFVFPTMGRVFKI